MMSVADIYDALTASDRPYKKAVPVERALDILDFSVKDGHLDAELVRHLQRGARRHRLERHQARGMRRLIAGPPEPRLMGDPTCAL
jgi:HD-GYP domain-containing protein (c-di-GMP phosphodiesterase class II)